MNTENERYKRFNSFPTPIIITNRNGLILYKNISTRSFGSFRIGSNLRKYLLQSDIEKMENCLSGNHSDILELEGKYFNSKLLLFPYEENAFIAAIISSLLMIYGTQANGNSVKISNYLRENVATLNAFKDNVIGTCGCDASLKFEKLLTRSNSLLFRAICHNVLALDRLNSFERHEGEPSLQNLVECIDKVYKDCNSYCTSLGYRIENGCFHNILCAFAKINIKDFISVYTTCLTLALRMSENGKCSCDYYQKDSQMLIKFKFSCSLFDEKRSLFSSEEIFLADACRLCGWGFYFSRVSMSSGEISLLIPLYDNTATVLKQTSEKFNLSDTEKGLLEAELSVLEICREDCFDA